MATCNAAEGSPVRVIDEIPARDPAVLPSETDVDPIVTVLLVKENSVPDSDKPVPAV